MRQIRIISTMTTSMHLYKTEGSVHEIRDAWWGGGGGGGGGGVCRLSKRHKRHKVDRGYNKHGHLTHRLKN